MTANELFEIWAPPSSVWSPWAKPVLFAHEDLLEQDARREEASPHTDWAPPPSEGTAIILDLPGAAGVQLGAALARKGYRPVPLYNALPAPAREVLLEAGAPIEPRTAVNVMPILRALRDEAPPLAAISLPPNAPPAFLLDANRQGEGQALQDSDFDNRSICFTTDFPSVNFLAAQNIQRGLLVQLSGLQPQTDLAHTLRRWQDGGLTLQCRQLEPPERAWPLDVPRPPWYRAMFQRALASFGLRPARGGGFGGWVQDSPGIG